MNTKATGTLAAQRHPLLQNLAGTLPIVSKTSGTLPTNRGNPQYNNPAWFDDFIWGGTNAGAIGDLGWTQLGGNIVNNQYSTGARKGHPGVLTLSESDILGAGASIVSTSQDNVGQVFMATETFDITTSVRIARAGSFTFAVGAGTVASFRVNGTYRGPLAAWGVGSSSPQKWRTMTGSGQTVVTNTGTGFYAGTWYKLRLRRNSTGSLAFYINDVLSFNVTGNVPSGTVQPGYKMHNRVGTAHPFDIDYFYMTISGLGR